MTFKKIFIWFSLVPVSISLINYYYSDIGKFTWGYDNGNEIGFTALTIAGLSCLFIIYKNFKTKQHNKFWYIFAGATSILFFGYLYIGYSLSNFGF